MEGRGVVKANTGHKKTVDSAWHDACTGGGLVQGVRMHMRLKRVKSYITSVLQTCVCCEECAGGVDRTVET